MLHDLLTDSMATKNILMSANAFLALKNNLINNIGSDKTKGFLFRFGKEFGLESAKNYFLKGTREKTVGKMHARLGHVKDVTFTGEIVKHSDGSIECKEARGKWVGSFEAELHVKNYGLATECVCHTLCGFASGALSYEFGESLIVIEAKCVAKGDPCCEYEVRLEQDWLPEQEKLINLYQNDNILSELEMTYDALLHHKQMLEKISTFHNQLTQKVTDKYSMEEIIQSAYQVLNIPIWIEDIHGNRLCQAGLTEEELQRIENGEAKLEHIEEINHVSHYRGRFYDKLVSPVFINKKVYARCSFFYFPPQGMEGSDYQFLERIATVIALCILYEEAQFEEQQRMRSSILERLIHKQNIQTIESYFKFLPFKFQAPYTTVVIQIDKKRADQEMIDLHEQLIQLSNLIKKWNLPAIYTVVGEEITLLHSQLNDKPDFIKTMTQILQQLEKQNGHYKYTVGISSTFTDLNQFEKTLKEARIAQRFPNKKLLTDYEDLGILGDIVINMSTEQLHEMAKKTLRALYHFDDPRKKELLHTLYVYLLNRQRLKETMEELALSIGGIQYRIKQIEELLQDSVKNASTASYILLVIQALILSGELQFD